MIAFPVSPPAGPRCAFRRFSMTRRRKVLSILNASRLRQLNLVAPLPQKATQLRALGIEESPRLFLECRRVQHQSSKPTLPRSCGLDACHIHAGVSFVLLPRSRDCSWFSEWRFQLAAEVLKANGYSMQFHPITPGEYELLAACKLKESDVLRLEEAAIQPHPVAESLHGDARQRCFLQCCDLRGFVA